MKKKKNVMYRKSVSLLAAAAMTAVLMTGQVYPVLAEGNTGPYILYTIVRIKSILNRYVEAGGNLEAGELLKASNGSEKNLMLQLSGFGSMIESAFEEKAPHKICAYIYEVSNAFNSFYHETKILSEENQAQKESYIRLLLLTKRVLETSIDLLGFEAPDKM